MKRDMVFGFALIAIASSGCVIEARMPPPRGVIVVSGPPPSPVDEAPSSRPAPQAIWVTGYWHWTGMQYTWIPGHWDTPPPGHRWRAPRYSLHDGVYVYEPGGWSQ
jgi:hypothetical protein